MSYREWLMLVGIILGLMGGLAAVIRLLVVRWMDNQEESSKELRKEWSVFQDRVTAWSESRATFHSQRDRELADLRLELARNYPRREELALAIDRIMDRVDIMAEKFDALKEAVLRKG